MYKIYLSPSNKSKSFGVKDFGNEEFRMKQIADVVQKKLLSAGKYAVYISKSEMGVGSVVEESNSIRPDVHIAIHSDDKAVAGIKCYTKDTDTVSNGFAKEIYKSLQKIYHDKEVDNGIIYDLSIQEITKVNAPAALVIVGCRSIEADAEWIVENIENIGEQIAEGIQKGFTLKSC